MIRINSQILGKKILRLEASDQMHVDNTCPHGFFVEKVSWSNFNKELIWYEHFRLLALYINLNMTLIVFLQSHSNTMRTLIQQFLYNYVHHTYHNCLDSKYPFIVLWCDSYICNVMTNFPYAIECTHQFWQTGGFKGTSLYSIRPMAVEHLPCNGNISTTWY